MPVVHSIAYTSSPARPGKHTTGVSQVSWASGLQTEVTISMSSASSAKGMPSASTVTWKLDVALPPEFVAVTVTVACTALSVGMLTRPVLASIVAPAPLTAKARFSPVKSAPAATVSTSLPRSEIISWSPPLATGAA